MKILGLTGGMGSGKTFLCGLFSALGAPCFQADAEAKALYAEDGDLCARMRGLLGGEVFAPSGALLPQKVAARIFADVSLREAVNALVHPRVFDRFRGWMQAQSAAPYVVLESALLLEIPVPVPLAAVATVSAPEAVRVARAAARDGREAAACWARIRAQASDPWREARATYVIQNNGHEALLPQVWAVHEALTARHDN